MKRIYMLEIDMPEELWAVFSTVRGGIVGPEIVDSEVVYALEGGLRETARNEWTDKQYETMPLMSDVKEASWKTEVRIKGKQLSRQVNIWIKKIEEST